MKYKVGDKVRIKNIDWYNENKDKFGNVPLFYPSRVSFNFLEIMSPFCGKEMTIIKIHDYGCK